MTMNRYFSRDLFILVTLFIVLVLAVALMAPGVRDQAADLSGLHTSYSSSPSGALALFLLTREVGLAPRTVEYQFRLPKEMRLLFVLDPPQRDWSRLETDEVIAWLRAGNTLVLACSWRPRLLSSNDPAASDPLLHRLDVGLGGSVPEDDPIQQQPILARPPVGRLALRATGRLTSTLPSAVTWLQVGKDAVVLEVPVGNGRAIVFTSAYPFTNKGIAEADNLGLVLNILNDLPAGAVVGFDEFHQGYDRERTLTGELFRRPWGWAAIYGAGIVLLYLVLSGQRFGRPVAAPGSARRTTGEYVTSLAGLLRRAGQRRAILEQEQKRLRRDLARPYALNPDLPAADFVAALARQTPVDQPTLLRLLSPPAGQLSERALLQRVDEIERFRTGFAT